MIQSIITPTAFNNYAVKLQSELELLKSFTLPDFKNWQIDWALSQAITQTPGKKKPWHQVDACKEMIALKSSPAIYYFTCDELDAPAIYSEFMTQKKSRLNNVSFVPDEFRGGNCIYVGSRRFGLHGRMVQHLGFKEKGGTGALYLHHVIKAMPVEPVITFHYVVLDSKYTNLTKHIEAVVQDELKPFIGKRAIEPFTVRMTIQNHLRQ